MDLGNQPKNDLSKTRSIEEIDTNGYLVDHHYTENDCERPYYDEVNDDDIWEEPNEDQVNLGCHEIEVNDDKILGKMFNTPDDAYTFYNQYAFLHGFGIRIHWDYKNKTTNEVYRKLYVCNKEGFKRRKADSSNEVSKKRRRDVRTGCKAELRISKTKDGKWCVDIFNDTHNHDLTPTPTKVMKHRSHNKFHRSMACKSLMVELGKSGLKPCQVRKAVNAMKSPNQPNVTSKQCADILAEERKQYKGKEFYSLIKHFQEKVAVDSNQYFKIDLFDDGSPRNIFWADGRSRDAYLKFGDVVVFDVTYLTNKFKFPFAPFVGVNHHGQSIIFGGALLENEKEETFKWLFGKFLECMFNKFPGAIITDQDKAICNAVKHIFPNTRHRYCAWHIKKHVLEHLQPFRVRYNDFQDSFKQWLRSDTIEEFETQWEVLRHKYNLETSSWMMEMYNQRKFWVTTFFKDVFLAGMTTSGRSESIHSFFDGFVNSKTMLNEFVIQFDKAVDTRRGAEEDEDFKTMNSMPILSSVHPLEAKAGKCYTKKIFEIFQKEWIEATNNLTHETKSKSSEQTSYWVYTQTS
ncbi:FAR1-related sequence 5-like protein [Tanacetum coccineum]